MVLSDGKDPSPQLNGSVPVQHASAVSTSDAEVPRWERGRSEVQNQTSPPVIPHMYSFLYAVLAKTTIHLAQISLFSG